MSRHELWELKQMQSLPLDAKIRMSKRRIDGWIDEYGEDGVYVAFSGGKDSTVLKHLVETYYPNVRSVYADTGLEYPKIREFVKSFDNVEIIKPKMNFKEVIIRYGYPVISKEVAQTVYEVFNSKSENKLKSYRMSKLNGTLIDKNGNLSQYNMPQYKFLINSPFKISHKCCDIMKKNPFKQYEKKSCCADFRNYGRREQTKTYKVA